MGFIKSLLYVLSFISQYFLVIEPIKNGSGMLLSLNFYFNKWKSLYLCLMYCKLTFILCSHQAEVNNERNASVDKQLT